MQQKSGTKQDYKNPSCAAVDFFTAYGVFI